MDVRAEQAVALLDRFAERTGLTSAVPPDRYLWTDAFAVCTWLGLGRTDLALRLVDQVHAVLGRHRLDDARTGWISGLPEEEGSARPTACGLRIGKKRPERSPDVPFDERLEWDRDGQYFHYLTKWMHALHQASQATGERRFLAWARELADVAHRAFTRPGRDGTLRMVWKRSIDLSRPLVASMGQHDPLDGLVACLELDAADPTIPPDLAAAERDFSTMLDPRGLATIDPLGLGGLLVDALRVVQLRRARFDDLVEALLLSARIGLRSWLAATDFTAPASERLAFREVGLAIGLAAVTPTRWGARTVGREHVEALAAHADVRERIEAFWLTEAHRAVDAWRLHENINDVMLATALAPDGFLATRRH